MQSTEGHEATAPAVESDPQPRGAEQTCGLPVAPWHPGWTGRHLLVAVAATVAARFFFGDLAIGGRHPDRARRGIGAGGPGWQVVRGLLSVASGLVVASYLPRAGGPVRLPRDVCGYAPLLMLFAAGFFLTMAEGSLWGASPALVLAAAAVLRRTTGSSTCSV